MIVHFLTSILVNKSGNVFCKEFLSCTRCTSLNKRRKQQQNLNDSHFPFQIHSISQNVCQKAYKNWDKCSKSCHFHNNINKSRIVVSKDVLPILKKQLKSKGALQRKLRPCFIRFEPKVIHHAATHMHHVPQNVLWHSVVHACTRTYPYLLISSFSLYNCLLTQDSSTV